MTLALLLTAVTGAWAQSSLDVVEFEVPAAWQGDNSNVAAADLPGFKASTLAEAKAWAGAPASDQAVLVYAFDGDKVCFVQFSNGKADEGKQSSWPKGFIFSVKSQIKFYYTTEITEWELTPDADKKVWTLAKMPANDIELQVEYYAESNIFLSEEALADKANISVLNGSTAVTFDDAGKSANTVTEGNTVTAKFTGTKKVLGVKAEKKAAAPKLLTLNIGGETSATIYYIEGESWKNAIENHPTENAGWRAFPSQITYDGSAYVLFYGGGNTKVNPEENIDSTKTYKMES